MTDPWPPEAIEAMRHMADERLSATQAAKKLGKSRNAVLGMAQRRGIKFHATRWTGVDPYLGPPRPPPKPRPKPLPKPVIPSEAPESRGLGMLDLGPMNCRWPFGDRDYTFCGAAIKEHSPYCEHHASISSAGTPKVKP